MSTLTANSNLRAAAQRRLANPNITPAQRAIYERAIALCNDFERQERANQARLAEAEARIRSRWGY